MFGIENDLSANKSSDFDERTTAKIIPELLRTLADR